MTPLECRWRAIVCLLFVTLGIQAQDNADYAVDLIPDSLRNGAHSVIRSEEKRFTVQSDRHGTLNYSKVVTILNGQSRENLVVIFYDSDTKISRFKAVLYDQNGNQIRKVRPSEITDRSAVQDFSIYEDNRVQYVEILHNEYPYTIAFEYQTNMSGINFGVFPSWRPKRLGVGIQQSTFIVESPENLPVHYQLANTELTPDVSPSSRNISHTWTASNQQALRKVPFSHPSYRSQPAVYTAPDRFRIGDYQGSMKSWKTYGEFVYQLYEGRDALPESIRSEVDDIIRPATSDREKIGLLYRYLQEKTRYVSVQLGIGGWQPFAAEYVEKNQYGDCKALTNYMKALLKEAGIKSYPALIKSGELTYEMTEDFASPKFNHVILHIPSEDYWLECTSSFYPPNYIGHSNSDRKVLLITEQGGKVVRTPALETSDNSLTRTVEIDLSDFAQTKLSVTSTRTGRLHERYRSYAKLLSKEDLWERFANGLPLKSFQLEELTVEPAVDAPQCRVDYQVSIRNFANRMGKRLFVPLNPISKDHFTIPKHPNRTAPVIWQRAYTKSDTIRIRLPEGFQPESIPEEDLKLEEAFGSFSLQIDRSKRGFITLYRKLTLRPAELPAEDYGKLRAFFVEIAKTDNARMVLVEKRT